MLQNRTVLTIRQCRKRLMKKLGMSVQKALMILNLIIKKISLKKLRKAQDIITLKMMGLCRMSRMVIIVRTHGSGEKLMNEIWAVYPPIFLTTF